MDCYGGALSVLFDAPDRPNHTMPMSSIVKFSIVVLVLIGVVFGALFLGNANDPSPPRGNVDEAAQTSEEAAGPSIVNTPPSPSTTHDVPHVDALRANAAAATQATADAGAKLSALEQQLELIEQQIRDIEARGDDPAEHADEVLPYFEPLFEQFLDAQAELEGAISRQAEADAALAAALNPN